MLIAMGCEDNCEVFYSFIHQWSVYSLRHICPLVGILITMPSTRCRTRCVSTGRVGAAVDLCRMSPALMHDGDEATWSTSCAWLWLLWHIDCKPTCRKWSFVAAAHSATETALSHRNCTQPQKLRVCIHGYTVIMLLLF